MKKLLYICLTIIGLKSGFAEPYCFIKIHHPNAAATVSRMMVFYFMENETWKDAIGYEGIYKVSNTGIIKSDRYGKFKTMMPTTNSTGYMAVGLIDKNNIRKKCLIHRIVALAFIPNPENKKTVNHINGIKSDNRVENLEWNTHQENVIHSYKSGLKIPTRGVQFVSRCKLNEGKVVEIRKLKSDGFTYKKIALQFDVAEQTVMDVVKRRRWAHVL